MFSLNGHIGARAAALVDGQLSPSEEERAWSHVLSCPGCRRLVEHEGWTKRQLGSLAAVPATGVDPSPQLLGSLYAVDAVDAAEVWAAVGAIEERSRRRRAAAVVGGGAVAASVLGLIALTGSPVGESELPSRPSPATIRGQVVGTVTGAMTDEETNVSDTWGHRAR
ncbi:MAG: hypothetical protein JWR20_2688 [Marmoricola sp.]|nr:hypothetical protein [Marmoricola sp.]